MSITPEAMESVLNAIQIIADASKKTDGNGDKTIVCTVVDDSNRHNSQLMVSDGSVKFMASLIQSADIDKYDVGDQVYVRIVQGDFSNDKIIDGFYVAGDATVPATFTPPLDTYIGGERETMQLVGVNLEDGKYSFDFTGINCWCRYAEKLVVMIGKILYNVFR